MAENKIKVKEISKLEQLMPGNYVRLAVEDDKPLPGKSKRLRRELGIGRYLGNTHGSEGSAIFVLERNSDIFSCACSLLEHLYFRGGTIFAHHSWTGCSYSIDSLRDIGIREDLLNG